MVPKVFKPSKFGCILIWLNLHHHHHHRILKFCIYFGQDLLERSSQIRSYTGEASWEAKAVAIIGCITDLEVGTVKNVHVIGCHEMGLWSCG